MDKASGGLSLNSREEMLKGGDTGPAIVVGDPDKSCCCRRFTRRAT